MPGNKPAPTGHQRRRLAASRQLASSYAAQAHACNSRDLPGVAQIRSSCTPVVYRTLPAPAISAVVHSASTPGRKPGRLTCAMPLYISSALATPPVVAGSRMSMPGTTSAQQDGRTAGQGHGEGSAAGTQRAWHSGDTAWAAAIRPATKWGKRAMARPVTPRQRLGHERLPSSSLAVLHLSPCHAPVASSSRVCVDDRLHTRGLKASTCKQGAATGAATRRCANASAVASATRPPPLNCTDFNGPSSSTRPGAS